jgi:hypothetical protein
VPWHVARLRSCLPPRPGAPEPVIRRPSFGPNDGQFARSAKHRSQNQRSGAGRSRGGPAGPSAASREAAPFTGPRSGAIEPFERQADTVAIWPLNRTIGRCQPSVLRGRSLTSAAICMTSSTLWTLRSVPFGK